MTFGEALELMKADSWNLLARAGWNGRGMFIHKYTPPASPLSKTDFDTLPYIEMKTADEKYVPWLASQTDMFAEDWVLVHSREDVE